LPFGHFNSPVYRSPAATAAGVRKALVFARGSIEKQAGSILRTAAQRGPGPNSGVIAGAGEIGAGALLFVEYTEAAAWRLGAEFRPALEPLAGAMV
jgi:hypothetical protein